MHARWRGCNFLLVCLQGWLISTPLLPLRVNANTCVISPFELLLSAALPKPEVTGKVIQSFFFCVCDRLCDPTPPHPHTHSCELICRLQWNIMITWPIKSLIWGKCRYLLNPHYQSCWLWVSCLFLSPRIDFSKVVINIPLRVPFFQLPPV